MSFLRHKEEDNFQHYKIFWKIIFNGMDKILTRINKIAENEAITITFLEKKIGASKGVLSRALAKNTDIQAKWLTAIVDNYPLYSVEWLVTGKGSMFRSENVSQLGESITTGQVIKIKLMEMLDKCQAEKNELYNRIIELEKQLLN